MRYRELTELAGVKQFRDMTASEILDTIGRTFGNGKATVLGTGANGAAVEINNQVYKFWMVDSAYTDFVNYCLKNKGNPFLPQFNSQIKRIPAFFVRHEEAPDYVNYVKMEKLQVVSDQVLYYNFDLAMTFHDEDDEDENGHLGYVNLQGVINIMAHMGDSVIPPLQDFTARLSRQTGHQYKVEDLSKELQLFVNTMAQIKQLGNHFMDLSPSNFMMRGKQLVILDPIANKEDTQLNYQFAKFDEKLWRDDDEGKPAMTSRRTK